MERKDVFMKNNISRNKNSFSGYVIQLVAFNAWRVTNEDLSGSPRMKFSPMRRQSGSKTETAKYSKRIIFHKSMVQKLIRGAIM